MPFNVINDALNPDEIAPSPLGDCPPALKLRPGDWVQVKSEMEILATLDDRGTLDALPFMPEMRKFCGRQFQVKSRADRTVAEKVALRRMSNAVHLAGVRCDGAAHGGCCRSCLIFWKEAWLTRVEPSTVVEATPLALPVPLSTSVGERYVCQATELRSATRHLPAHELRQFVEALRGEDLSFINLLRALAIYARDIVVWRVFRRPEWEWNFLGGPCTTTPTVSLNLRPGERVRVKSKREIVATLDRKGWNRGMEFSREMLPCCGKEFTVLRRMERIIAGTSGRMVSMENTVILEGLVYKDLVRLAAPRSEYMYWRECWLERV